MIKIIKSNIFDFPRRRRRIACYVEVLCAELMKLDKIGSEEIESYWKEVNRIKNEKLRPHWLKENMGIEAKQGLNMMLNNYRHDFTRNVYKRT
jgi:hypothetical protein